jgi:hypothetical protein
LSPGRRQVYAYWRLRADDWPAVLVALHRLHDQLQREHPGLIARCLQRVDAAEDLTCMEVYQTDAALLPDGVDAALAQAIAAAAAPLVGPWQHGERHVETFDEVPP